MTAKQSRPPSSAWRPGYIFTGGGFDGGSGQHTMRLRLLALARRPIVPVTLDLAIDRRLPDSVEVGAYYIVAEALTNAAKHACASHVEAHADSKGDILYLSIRDDGSAGAEVGKGSGLIGLKDRAEALGGQMQITSPAGAGTALEVTIPLGSE